jgi:hypothetical protein
MEYFDKFKVWWESQTPYRKIFWVALTVIILLALSCSNSNAADRGVLEPVEPDVEVYALPAASTGLEGNLQVFDTTPSMDNYYVCMVKSADIVHPMERAAFMQACKAPLELYHAKTKMGFEAQLRVAQLNKDPGIWKTALAQGFGQAIGTLPAVFFNYALHKDDAKYAFQTEQVRWNTVSEIASVPTGPISITAGTSARFALGSDGSFNTSGGDLSSLSGGAFSPPTTTNTDSFNTNLCGAGGSPDNQSSSTTC